MSDFTIVADVGEAGTLTYINLTCAVMTAIDGWVLTENSVSPSLPLQTESGNSGVSEIPITPSSRLNPDCQKRIRVSDVTRNDSTAWIPQLPQRF